MGVGAVGLVAVIALLQNIVERLAWTSNPNPLVLLALSRLAKCSLVVPH